MKLAGNCIYSHLPNRQNYVRMLPTRIRPSAIHVISHSLMGLACSKHDRLSQQINPLSQNRQALHENASQRRWLFDPHLIQCIILCLGKRQLTNVNVHQTIVFKCCGSTRFQNCCRNDWVHTDTGPM